MKRLTLLILYISLIFCPIFAQNTSSDSLNIYSDSCFQAIRCGDFSSVTDFAQKALLFVPADSVQKKNEFYAKLTSAYFRLGDFNSALKWGKLSLQTSEKSGDKFLQSCALNNMAAIYLVMDLTDDAERYVVQSIHLERECFPGQTCRLAMRLAKLGEVYQTQNRLQQALDTTYLAFRLDSIDGREPNMAIRMSQLGAICESMGDYDKAENYLLAALPLLTKYNNVTSICLSNISLSRIYAHKGATKQALDAIRISEELAQEHNMQHSMLMVCQQLMKIADTSEEKLHYAQRALALSDSIYSETVQQKMAHYVAECKAAESEIQLLEQQKKIDTQHLYIVWLVVTLVFLLLIILVVLMFARVRMHSRNRDRIYAAAVDLASDTAQKQSVSNEKKQEETDVHFSEREREVIRYCCKGLSSKQIAEEMCLSPRTVEGYKNGIFKKLGINTTIELVIYAVKHNIQ